MTKKPLTIGQKQISERSKKRFSKNFAEIRASRIKNEHQPKRPLGIMELCEQDISILNLLVEGKSIRKIAGELRISLGMVNRGIAKIRRVDGLKLPEQLRRKPKLE